MYAQQLWFHRAKQIEVREVHLAPLRSGEILVTTECSAISVGTELLAFRNQLPADIPLDSQIAHLNHAVEFPLRYGYACVGRVTAIGADVNEKCLGTRIFAFEPHASHFIARAEQVINVPADITAEQAVFLANMETAVSLVQQGAPGIGENIAVIGLGVVGLLLAQLLQQFPSSRLVGLDKLASRRAIAKQVGIDDLANPTDETQWRNLIAQLAPQGADLIYEISGNPTALNLAFELTGFASRVILGSWYGDKSCQVNLGGAVHRNHIQLITSQVSRIAPALTGRWDKQRRFATSWDMIRLLQPERIIDKRLSLDAAADIYRQLDERPEECLQPIFIY
ncbi:MAG: zinc-binding alcohol dehydrogenase [Moraxellaceae bacterium]|nr:MAG: zinc-binding alcohol dehydrogenase [Moraxellaceae bacterium]